MFILAVNCKLPVFVFIMPTYLNTAACGLLSPQSLETGYEFYNAMLTNSSTRAEAWKATEWQRMRVVAASFIKCTGTERGFYS